MSSKLIFKNGKSKTAAIVLSSVSFALSFAALTVYFTGNFFAVWLALPLVLAFLAGFVLTICAVAVNPKLLTAASVVTMLSHFLLLFAVLSQASDCVIFEDLPKWVQIVVPIALAALFAAFYVGFAVVASKQSKSGAERNKSVKPLFVLLIIVVALILGFDVASAVLGQKSILSKKEYLGGKKSAYQIFYEFNDHDSYFQTYWTDANGDTNLVVYDYSNRVSLDINEQYTAIDYCTVALSQMVPDGSVRINDCLMLKSGSDYQEIIKNYTAYPQYLLVLYEYSWENDVELLKFNGHYKDGFYSARQMFETVNNVNLARTDSYKIVPKSYSYFGFANSPSLTKLNRNSLTIAEVKTVYRFPNVFFAAAAICGLTALYLLAVRCEIVEADTRAAIKTSGAYNLNGMQNRLVKQNIALNVFLTVVTLGIYGYVWFYYIAKNARVLKNDGLDGVGDEVALRVVGGGVYAAYWYYSRSKSFSEFTSERGLTDKCLSPVSYLILSVFSFGILPLCLFTNDVNGIIDRLNGGEEQSAADAATLRLMENKLELVKTVLLSVVTLGIYYVITVSRVVNRVNILKGNAPASTKRLVCLFLVPFYWIYFLAVYLDKLNEDGNRAVLEAWLVNILPFYGTYWLIKNADGLFRTANEYYVKYRTSAALNVLFAFLPAVGFGVILSVLDRVSARIDIPGEETAEQI